eukprot:TRINITY_DN36572_c0_g1_i1.p1 TRINITY_DN36572_c0_g1~~TRINITY_DN36572_c0_g1_i1.p1  ORF type:complete len:857 (-),score=154.33 TRINITY_DN36572_c0_g1_i1:44-2614(-)
MASVGIWLGAYGHLSDDEELRLCGSVAELGNWCLERAPSLQRVEGEEGFWVIQAVLPQHVRVEFKFALSGYTYNYQSKERYTKWFGGGIDMTENVTLQVGANNSGHLSGGPLPFCLHILDAKPTQRLLPSLRTVESNSTDISSSAGSVDMCTMGDDTSGYPASNCPSIATPAKKVPSKYPARPRKPEPLVLSENVPNKRQARLHQLPLQSEGVYVAEADLNLNLPDLQSVGLAVAPNESTRQEAHAIWTSGRQKHSSLRLRSESLRTGLQAFMSCTRQVLRNLYAVAAEKLDCLLEPKEPAAKPESSLGKMLRNCLELREHLEQAFDDEVNIAAVRNAEHRGEGRTSTEMQLLLTMSEVRDVIEQCRSIEQISKSKLLHREVAQLRLHVDERLYEGFLGARARLLDPESPRMPVFMMLPLDWASEDGRGLRDESRLRQQLATIKACGVSGVMADVWWARSEAEPGQYHFGCVQSLCALLKEMQLQLQAVMSFHRCGGNVGDSVTVSLPVWVLDVAREKQLLYCDMYGEASEECLSLAADTAAAFPGANRARTALDCYGDFTAAFARSCAEHMGVTITEIQVSMGPCGELRYPSYLLSKGWSYPGVGLVMAHDPGMKECLQRETGLNEPPEGLPSDQNDTPDDVPLFRTAWRQGGTGKPLFRFGAGKAFLEWYTKVLLDHGERVILEIISAVRRACQGTMPEHLAFSAKISGIHWQMQHPSRAAEMCAGYNCCTSSYADAYADIAEMLARVAEVTGCQIFFNFTCMEMESSQNDALSDTEALISQVRRACIANNLPMCGENALSFDLSTGSHQFKQMQKVARSWSRGPDRMQKITILRLDDTYTRGLKALKDFVHSI